MALKSVGGRDPDPRPSWERPYVPITKRVKGKEELEEAIAVRPTKSQMRHIRLICESSQHPEVHTNSEFLQACIMFGLDYFARRDDNPELQRMVRSDIRTAELAWMKAQRLKDENIVDDCEEQLATSIGKSGGVERKGQFLSAWKILSGAVDDLPDDLRIRAAQLLAEYQPRRDEL